MQSVPEGVETVSGEGRDVVTALAQAAEALGLETKQVKYTIDMSHFRNQATGSTVSRDSVKIIAWQRPEGEEAPEEEKAAPRVEREKPVKEEASEPEAPANPLEASPVSDIACEWLGVLLKHMNIEATVEGGADESRVMLAIRADQPGRIVGKRGSTLSSIRHLLRLMLVEHGDPIIDVDVDKDGVAIDLTPRKRERQARDRNDRNDRNDRGRGRNDRGRGRNDRGRDDRGRDDRGRDDRGRGRNDRDDDRRGRVAPETLKALARRAAEKAIESGKVITITKELNSYDRRLVHMTIADIEGIQSRSEEKDGMKFVQVIPE
jgi:predicted RNA-binding protein Jag